MATPRPGAERAGRSPGGKTQPEGRLWDYTPERTTPADTALNSTAKPWAKGWRMR